MALHFDRREYDDRLAATLEAMEARKLDALLMFAQESMYWLTGYDTFGFCFFQAMVLTKTGRFTLVTRAPDLRQAQHTSIVEDIRVWVDRGEADPSGQLKETLFELELLGTRIGIEYDTHGLTAAHGRKIDDGLKSFATLVDASDLVPSLRMVKSPAEIAVVREAARIADLAWETALPEIHAGANEGHILAVLQGTVFEAGGE